ncbi:hypothetical protein XENTR_v10011271 [Xenopus tropicalis]|nr:hypothetical protein XENTR_v10011271 [Xenopus tropicalis]
MAGDMTIKINEGVERCSNICSILVQVIVGLIITAFAIAMIVVGAMHLNECPAERFVPIYLIVTGAFLLSYWLFFPLEFFFPTIRKVLSGLVGLFLFAWLIAGSVWVFRIYNNNPRLCQVNMYLFAFSVIIIQWILLGLGIIFSLITCFCSKIMCCCNRKV